MRFSRTLLATVGLMLNASVLYAPSYAHDPSKCEMRVLLFETEIAILQMHLSKQEVFALKLEAEIRNVSTSPVSVEVQTLVADLLTAGLPTFLQLSSEQTEITVEALKQAVKAIECLSEGE